MANKIKKSLAVSLAALSLVAFAGNITDSTGIPVLCDNTITAEAMGLMYCYANKENAHLIKDVTSDLHPVFNNSTGESKYGEERYYEYDFKTGDSSTASRFISNVINEVYKNKRFVIIGNKASRTYAGYVIYDYKYGYFYLYNPKTKRDQTVYATSLTRDFNCRRTGSVYTSFIIKETINDYMPIEEIEEEIEYVDCYGDVNEDGKIDSADISLLDQYLSGWNVTINKENADVVYDGKIDDEDLARLQQYVSGWNVHLGPTWY